MQNADAFALPVLCGCLLIIHIELGNRYYLVSRWVDVSAYCFFLGVIGHLSELLQPSGIFPGLLAPYL
jgi:hypothetical protein